MTTSMGRARTHRAIGGAAAAALLLAGCGGGQVTSQPVPVTVTYAQSTSVEDARRILKGKPSPYVALDAVDRFRAAGNREAVFLLVKYAAHRGAPEAAYEMGRRYDPATHVKDGIVLKPHVPTAAEWYERAAHAGHRASMIRLGEMYRDGLLEATGDMDATERSFYWFEKAEQGRGKG